MNRRKDKTNASITVNVIKDDANQNMITPAKSTPSKSKNQSGSSSPKYKPLNAKVEVHTKSKTPNASTQKQAAKSQSFTFTAAQQSVHNGADKRTELQRITSESSSHRNNDKNIKIKKKKKKTVRRDEVKIENIEAQEDNGKIIIACLLCSLCLLFAGVVFDPCSALVVAFLLLV